MAAAAPVEGGPTLEGALELLRRDDVLGFAQQLKGVRDADAARVAAERAAGEEAPDRPSAGARSAGAREGGSTRPSDELHELIWRGKGSQTVKQGKRVPRDFYEKHEDHVHVAAGPTQIEALGKLAQRMGLTVSENPGFGDAVDPVHVAGSHHNRRGKSKRTKKTYGGAIDVSGDPEAMEEYAGRVAAGYGL
jgi:hypothetical protein